MVFINPNTIWAISQMLVPKPGPASFLFTLYLRVFNNFTLGHQYPMTNLEVELTKTSNSFFWAVFDLFHGYWKFPLHTESLECQSLITPDGMYTLTHDIHGTTNDVTYLQYIFRQCFLQVYSRTSCTVWTTLSAKPEPFKSCFRILPNFWTIRQEPLQASSGQAYNL